MGTLVDIAEMEGRDEPARSERRSIITHGSALRLARVVPQVLFVAAAAALLLLASRLLAGGAWETAIVLYVPPVPAPRDGDVFSTPSIITTHGALCLVLAAAAAACGTIGALLRRANRRALRV